MSKQNNINYQKGFTLVELLVVIGVIALIIGVVLPNLVGVRGRARDAKRKSEMRELKSALRLYYNDFSNYPSRMLSSPWIQGCGNDGLQNCPDSCSGKEFSAGGTTCDTRTLYMKRYPRMTSDGTDYGFGYWTNVSKDDFCLQTTLENPADKEISISQSRCASICGVNCNGGTNYCMCAD